MAEVRYQVFVSSTYEDLREERQQATQAILEIGYFPSGMELFPASDDSQWELIKRVIEESDYYIVVVAARYGSVGPQGKSYTEMEYDYAVQKGIPVLGFVKADLGTVQQNKGEDSDKGRKKLEAFRQKVLSRTCRRYSTPAELGMAVMKSLMAEVRVRPRTGWIRADQARSASDISRERQLMEELAETRERVSELEREIRDRSILVSDLSRETLAQGDDLFDLLVTFQDSNKVHVSEKIAVSWDEIFRVIAPDMYGYIIRKTKERFGGKEKYPFQTNVEEYIRSKIIDRVQGRVIRFDSGQLDAIILQFKELGLLRFDETKEADGDVFRGVTLTEAGERRLTILSATRRRM